MFETKKHSYLDLFEGIIIGGSLAAAATFLFGTKKGKELQKKLVSQFKKFGHITQRMKDKVDKIIHLHAAKKVKRVVKSKIKKVKQKIKSVKKRASRKGT